MIYSYELSCDSKVNIGKREFALLYVKGLIDLRGRILKSKLSEAEIYLQECGWNGVFVELHDKDKFDKLSNVVELVVC